MKKLFAIFVMLVMLFALAVPTAALVMTADTIDPETGEVIPGHAVIGDDPYSVLYSEFFPDGNRPDDFAGIWVNYDENGKEFYTFALVEGTDASKYEAVLGDYAGQYRFEYLPYSYNTLLHVRDVVFERVYDIMSGAGVYESENKIHFDVRVNKDEENGRIAQAMLDVKNEENLPDGIESAFVIEYGVIIVPAIAFEDTADEVTENPHTGVIYAALPMAVAVAAIAIFRKKK